MRPHAYLLVTENGETRVCDCYVDNRTRQLLHVTERTWGIWEEYSPENMQPNLGTDSRVETQPPIEDYDKLELAERMNRLFASTGKKLWYVEIADSKWPLEDGPPPHPGLPPYDKPTAKTQCPSCNGTMSTVAPDPGYRESQALDCDSCKKHFSYVASSGANDDAFGLIHRPHTLQHRVGEAQTQQANNCPTDPCTMPGDDGHSRSIASQSTQHRQKRKTTLTLDF